MPEDKPPKGQSRRPEVVDDEREALERELMWAIALGGDRRRIEALERMLTPAANDAFRARRVAGDEVDDWSEDGAS